MMKEFKVGLMGLGTVGSGVYTVLKNNREKISKEVGAVISVKRVLEKDLEKAKKIGVPLEIVTQEPSEIWNDEEIEIVIEVIGGVEPARTFILESIKRGKSVVTANKELLALHGEEIFNEVSKRGVDFFFEASVGGGIPIIKPLKETLAGNMIRKVLGIVNGTTNYILTRMSEKGYTFKEALKEAQEKGYAERDPSADIEGRDAASKIAILASIAFNSRVSSKDVFTEGIQSITPQDINYADELGFVIKLLAIAQEEEGKIDVRVHPALLSKNHPLASVKGVNNAIFVEGDAVGEVMFYGPGAGGFAAGSSVVGDVIDAARNILKGSRGRVGCTCFEDKPLREMELLKARYYLLLEVLDKPGVLAAIAKEFGDAGVSLASVIQKESHGETAEVVFMTYQTEEGKVRVAREGLERLSVVKKIRNILRVEV
jgi:homoserine dehydrogenase